MSLRILSRVFIAFFIYLVVTHLYTGIISDPLEGDSLAYHIPIAKAVLDGTIIDPSQFSASPFLKYSPGTAELLLVPLMLFKIPLNIYNVLAVIALFFVCIFTGRRVGLSKEYSIIFAVTICSLNGIVRWMNTQIIDIWLLVFFILSLGLLEKPEKSIKYFLKLGFAIGLLCGTKFTGPIFSFILFIFYFKKIFSVLNLKNILSFSFPFLIFGFSWYMRNFLLTGNPIYPQPFLFLKGGGDQFSILNIQVWRILSNYPKGFFMTVNAYIAEFTIWTLAIFGNIFYLYKKFVKKQISKSFDLIRIFSIGLLIFIIYLFLPSALEEHITVSVFRYSFAAFTLFILCIFLIAQKYKKEELLSMIAISNIFIMGFPHTYYPKLVFIYIPIALGVIYWEQIKRFVILRVRVRSKRIDPPASQRKALRAGE